MSQFSSHSPPPLRHPVPTHPAYIPEPPPTPHGYQRFSSSPGPGGGSVPLSGQQNQQAYLMPTAAAGPQRVPAYTTPFQHAQVGGGGGSQGYAHHGGIGGQAQGSQQGGSYAAAAAHPEPATADFRAWGLDGATAQLGMQLGSSAVAAGQDYVQKNFGTLIPQTTHIKHHFNVSNSYVIKKLRLVLFPWLHRPWSRRSIGNPQGGPGQAQAEYLPPREDINCPDLYIPVMSIVTYILIAAFNAGINSRFNPAILGDSASRATVVVLFDFLFVKLGCYILNISGSSQVVDLVAYGGYKFVGVIFSLIAGFVMRGPFWTLIFIYTFLANAFFLLRSLRTIILPDSSSIPASHAATTVTHAQRRRRIAFLLMEAGLQLLYMGWLVRV